MQCHANRLSWSGTWSARKLEPVSGSIVPVSGGEPFARSYAARLARGLGIAVGSVLAVIVAQLSGYGWLYALRGWHWLPGPPAIGDALPLLQLAGFDVQPLPRVLVAWLLAGLLAGIILVGRPPGPRAISVGLLGLVALLLASQAAFALARNLRFDHVLFGHFPGVGGLVEAAALALGSYLPGGVIGRRQRAAAAGGGSGRLGALRHLGLGAGEHRHAAKHDGDRDHMSDHHERLRTQ